jgi:hypothetical protein
MSYPKYPTAYDKFVKDTEKTAEKNGVTIHPSSFLFMRGRMIKLGLG